MTRTRTISTQAGSGSVTYLERDRAQRDGVSRWGDLVVPPATWHLAWPGRLGTLGTCSNILPPRMSSRSYCGGAADAAVEHLMQSFPCRQVSRQLTIFVAAGLGGLGMWHNRSPACACCEFPIDECGVRYGLPRVLPDCSLLHWLLCACYSADYLLLRTNRAESVIETASV